jgi:hypothetical protein
MVFVNAKVITPNALRKCGARTSISVLFSLANLNVTVITPDKLTELLDGKSGRVKRV